MYINIKKLTTALILTGSVQAGHKNGHMHIIQIIGNVTYNLDYSGRWQTW
jgi:hypothetical protein